MNFAEPPKYKVPKYLFKFLAFLGIIKPTSFVEMLIASAKMPKFRLGNQFYKWSNQNNHFVIYIDNAGQFVLSFNSKIVGAYRTLPEAKQIAKDVYVDHLKKLFNHE